MTRVVQTPDAVELDDLRVSADRLVEASDDQTVAVVRLAEVRSAALRYTFRSAHPLVELVFGLALASLAGVPAYHAYLWIRDGGTFYVPFAALVIPAIWGASLIASAPRRGFVLDVRTDVARHRLLFGRRTDVAEIRTFLKAARERFGLKVEDDAPR